MTDTQPQTTEPVKEESAEKAEDVKTATVKNKGKKKKKVIRQIVHGNAYIQATYNNTIVSIADCNGSVLAWSSSGKVGFKGPKKATPYAASQVVKDVTEKVAIYGMRDVHVFVKGIGGGREGAIRGLNANGLNVLSVSDVTPVPHNGCRPPKKRRV